MLRAPYPHVFVGAPGQARAVQVAMRMLNEEQRFAAFLVLGGFLKPLRNLVMKPVMPKGALN